MSRQIRTKDRLAKDLRMFGAPAKMVEYAKNGFYDDYESPMAAPIMRLIEDCLENGLNEVAERAKNGEYDGTAEESKEWLERSGKEHLDDDTYRALYGE